MGYSSVRIKARRRKVASLVAYSRQYTINNNTIRKSDLEAKDFGERKHPQPKSLKKKHYKVWFTKEYKEELGCEVYERHCKLIKSEFPSSKDYQKSLWKNLGIAAKMKAYEDEKVKKWERKHPKPCPEDDLFKAEFIPAWEHEREQAIERIRDFVVSMFDKVRLLGRYKKTDANFEHRIVAHIKDKHNEGHNINDLNPATSPLMKKAQKETNKEKKKNPKLVATNLKDHKQTHGRIILPKAA